MISGDEAGGYNAGLKWTNSVGYLDCFIGCYTVVVIIEKANRCAYFSNTEYDRITTYDCLGVDADLIIAHD